MPIKIPNRLPAAKTLESENVFVITEQRAFHQDIRPLRIAILNLMPTKIETETQLLRLLGNTPLQIEIELLQTATHKSKNTSAEHLLAFYKTYKEVQNERFDGLIITGAPVEHLPFEEVHYWKELCKIMDWANSHVYSTLHICWGAFAGLYHRYGIAQHPLPKKLSGVYAHHPLLPLHPLLRGFDDTFYAPHSRHTEVWRSDAETVKELDILSSSEEAGLYILADHACRNIFVTGHSEYARATLANEYSRDVLKGLEPDLPVHYFPKDDSTRRPIMSWKSCANLLFGNWINHIVYQHTPYDLSEL